MVVVVLEVTHSCDLINGFQCSYLCCRARKQVDYAHSDKDFENDDGK